MCHRRTSRDVVPDAARLWSDRHAQRITIGRSNRLMKKIKPGRNRDGGGGIEPAHAQAFAKDEPGTDKAESTGNPMGVGSPGPARPAPPDSGTICAMAPSRGADNSPGILFRIGAIAKRIRPAELAPKAAIENIMIPNFT